MAGTANSEATANGAAKAALGGAAAGGVIGGLMLEGGAVGGLLGPVGLVAGVAAGAAIGTAIYGYSKWRDAQPVGACSCCDQPVIAVDAKLRLSNCAKCNALVCKGCRRSNPLSTAFPDSVWSRTICLCPQCSAEANRMLENANAVPVFAATYKGSVPLDTGRPQADIQSDFFRSQEAAELHMRLLAIEQGFNLVVQRRYESRQQKDGKYIHKVWGATGQAGKRLD